MKTRIKTVAISVMVLVMLLTGCFTKRYYKGPIRKQSEIAVIDTQATMAHLGYWIWPSISSIDGVGTGKSKIYDSMRRLKRFEVLPGKHTLRVTIVSGSAERGTYTPYLKPLIFTALAGRGYVVQIIKDNQKGWKPVIIDRESKVSVHLQ